MKNDCTNDDDISADVGGVPLPDLSYPGELPLDVNKYLPYVEDFDMSEEKKAEFLHTLWSIMSAFVDLGWGVDSVQNFIPALREFSSQEPDKNASLKIQSCSSEFTKSAGAEEKKGKDHD